MLVQGRRVSPERRYEAIPQKNERILVNLQFSSRADRICGRCGPAVVKVIMAQINPEDDFAGYMDQVQARQASYDRQRQLVEEHEVSLFSCNC